LYDVGFNHFFKAPNDVDGGDLVYFQGHISPGMDGNTILLGMNALKHLELRQANNSLTLTIPNI